MLKINEGEYKEVEVLHRDNAGTGIDPSTFHEVKIYLILNDTFKTLVEYSLNNAGGEVKPMTIIPGDSDGDKLRIIIPPEITEGYAGNDLLIQVTTEEIEGKPKKRITKLGRIYKAK